MVFFIYKYKYIYIPCAFLICLSFIYGSQFFVKNLPYFFLSLYFCATVDRCLSEPECLFLDCVNELFRVLFEWRLSNKVFLFKNHTAVVITAIFPAVHCHPTSPRPQSTSVALLPPGGHSMELHQVTFNDSG